MGRAERLAARRCLRRPERARDLAADRSRVRLRVRQARPAAAPTGDVPSPRPDLRYWLGHGGRPVVQSRGQRWAEVDGSDCCAATRCGQAADVRGAGLGDGGLRRGDRGGDGAGRLADHSDGRPRDLPAGSDRQYRQPDGFDGGHPPRVVPGGSGLDHPRRRLLGSWRRCRPPPVASRPLDGRALDRLRLDLDAAGSRRARRRYVPRVEGDRMTRHRWFLPETPDVLGKLQAQTAITMEAMEALVAWSVGEPGAADRLRECEHRADECKRELRAELTVAFTTSLEPEDIFALSTELDRVLNGAKNAVREAEVMEIG